MEPSDFPAFSLQHRRYNHIACAESGVMLLSNEPLEGLESTLPEPQIIVTDNMVQLSLAMIVRNEAADIARCLGEIRPLVDEMVVVDTGSDDNTPALAAEAGAAVFHHKWKDDFSEARNAAVQRARGEWIIFLDADEEVAEEDFPRIRELLRSAAGDACSFIIRNYMIEEGRQSDWQPDDGSYRQSTGFTGWVPVRLVRLWRNDPRYRFSGIIHETINASLNEHKARIESTDIPIHHYGRGRPDRAAKTDLYLRLGLKEIARQPDNFKPHYEVGLIHLDRRELDQALQYLTEAARLSPQSPKVLSDLGYALLQLGHGEEAVRTLQQALELDPTLEPAHLNLGVALFKAGDLDPALEHFRAAVAKNPSRAQTHHNLGATQARRGRPDEAAEHLERARGIKPDDPDNLLLLAIALQQTGRLREALRRIEEAAKLRPDDRKIIYRTGMIQEELGLIREAVGSYRLLVRLWPETAPEVQARLKAMETGLTESGP
ncbi:tetratricopeptide repeat protein [candidate division KSB1 bacterium]